MKYKLYKKILKKINLELKYIFDTIQNLMKTIHLHFKNDILNQHDYNTNITKLEEILNKFNVLPNPINLCDMKTLNFKKIREIINYLNNELKVVCQNSGAYTINDLVKIVIKKKLNSDDKLTIFLNNVFKPTKCVVYDKQSKSLDNSLVVYTNEEKEDSEEIDYEDIHNINCIKFKSLNKKNMSIIEHINGIRIYLPIFLKKGSSLKFKAKSSKSSVSFFVKSLLERKSFFFM